MLLHKHQIFKYFGTLNFLLKGDWVCCQAINVLTLRKRRSQKPTGCRSDNVIKISHLQNKV